MIHRSEYICYTSIEKYFGAYLMTFVQGSFVLAVLDYEKKVYTVMVNKSTNINVRNNYLSPQLAISIPKPSKDHSVQCSAYNTN